ncbi:hypothetical protein SUNI508_08759 [Seiridium unicorne]|uniref:C2H2-type domain-containing protein n=1 Tax=Seiridium unicorne TaxID=138068 RepID=A0ABR2US96_9PEZI
MGEIWDDVLTTQKERDALIQAIDADKELCATEHKKRHPAECPECWPRLINRIRDRYLNSSTREWFSGRRLFLQELDTMFADARDRSVTIDDIDNRIQAEKLDWSREKLKNLGLVSATDSPDTVKTLLNDKEKPIDQLIPALRTAISKDADDSQKAFQEFTSKMVAATSPEAKVEAYVETFFQTKNDPQGAAKCQKYIDMVRSGTSMSDVVALMIRERQAQGIKKQEKQFFLRRKDELTRAKAANEAAKAKKAKAKQDRIRAAAAAAQEYDLPPCVNCKKPLDEQSLKYCPICVTLSEVYGFSDIAPTYFCSDNCWEDGIQSHLTDAGHVCAGGDGFTQTSGDLSGAGYCKECVLDHKVESFFCGLQCFDANFQDHRENVHIPKRDKVGEIYEDENDLEFTSNDDSQYRARKIEDHWIPVGDAVKEWVKKLGATYTPTSIPAITASND